MDSKRYTEAQWLSLPQPARPLVDPFRRRHLLRNYIILSILSVGFTFCALYLTRNAFNEPVSVTRSFRDPADEWRDDTWPIREQTPWDISTDYPYPRKLAYDVSEGTWLRLDVHPKTGDIVFDMVGDLYCIPAGGSIGPESVSRARPILRGVPHDSDPHFSPEGARLVFRSDAELGVENIWVMEWKGCEEMEVESGDAVLKEEDEELLAKGVRETPERRVRRLTREGRLGALRVTNETYRWVSDARFHPSGTKVVATKWYTSSRSLGAGEGWEYEVPSLEDIRNGVQPQIPVGSGTRVLSRTLPRGWTSSDYGDQQIGPEQIIWCGNDSVIFSKNSVDSSRFSYSKDVHSGIYAIYQRNLTTGSTEKIVITRPGGASRPELSRDGRSLAFVRRVRDKAALVLKDLETGTIHHIWHGLTYDLTTISAPMGTYPSYAFTPSDDAVIIWAAGQIYRVPLSVNERGERVSGGTPHPIRFTARIEKRLAETLREGTRNLVQLETQETQRVQAFKELRVDEKGGRALFQAAGVTYLHNVYERGTFKVPILHPEQPYYSPDFVKNAHDLVLHARWSDVNFTSFEIANLTAQTAFEVEGLPLGRYFSPILCGSEGRTRRIAFVKVASDYLSGNIIATANPGLYLGTVTLPSDWNAQGLDKGTIPIRDLTFVKSRISPTDRVNMQFLEGSNKLLVHQSSRSFIIDLGAGSDAHGNYPHHTLAEGKMSSELATSVKLDKKGENYVPDNVAFVDFFHVYVAPGKAVVGDGDGAGEGGVWSKPGNSTKGLARLSVDGGHDITWSGDGKKLFWFLGPYLHSVEVYRLSRCATSIIQDKVNFGINCVKDLLYYQEVHVEHSTDIARLKKEASGFRPGIQTPASKDAEHEVSYTINDKDNGAITDLMIIFNATLLTMATGKQETDLIRGGILIVRGGVIDAVATLETFSEVDVKGAIVIDAKGGFVVPGFIDVHAHWEGYSTKFPSKSWEMETFLAYGITTLHNPSAGTVDAPIERARIEGGFMIGPRIFTVGDIIYGAGIPGIHQYIVDLDEAKEALTRIKAEAGPFGISYKNYNIPSRASRQRLLSVARNFSMLCVPEGGMNWDWDLTYIIDGMTTVEHSIPVPVLYEDVQTLYALSGTGNTPTHIVNYGGAWGEQFVWANEDIPNDPKLRRFMRHDILETLSESTARPKNSYQFFNASASVAQMVKKGLLANIGAHGEQPLGVNYHAEMEFTRAGGLTRYEVRPSVMTSPTHSIH
ncbi:amidohydrolase, variant 3 [Coprinopsis cinerea AmutBmut pab1-1]|nr:amidohydrolase, variant 3 [Coprinopsis cinerea AmutBmut pab1-1]